MFMNNQKTDMELPRYFVISDTNRNRFLLINTGYQ